MAYQNILEQICCFESLLFRGTFFLTSLKKKRRGGAYSLVLRNKNVMERNLIPSVAKANVNASKQAKATVRRVQQEQLRLKRQRQTVRFYTKEFWKWIIALVDDDWMFLRTILRARAREVSFSLLIRWIHADAFSSLDSDWTGCSAWLVRWEREYRQPDANRWQQDFCCHS